MANSRSSTVQPIIWPEGTYVVMEEMGHCKVCGYWKDLRCGACFDCASHVDGKPIPGGHELWDKRNPSNRWKVRVS